MTTKTAKPTIVALWIYTGNSPNGKDCPRRGDFQMALNAYNYWMMHGNDETVQRIAASRAGVRDAGRAFGRTYAFRITNPEAVNQYAEMLA